VQNRLAPLHITHHYTTHHFANYPHKHNITTTPRPIPYHIGKQAKPAQYIYQANDGNTLVMPYMDIKPLLSCAGAWVTEPDEEHNGKVWLVLNIRGVYVANGTYRLEKLQEPKVAELMPHIIESYPNKWQGASWVQTLDIKLNEIIGNDTAPIIAERERIIKEREQKRIAENEERQRLANEREQQRLKVLDAEHQKLKNGEQISLSYFIDLIGYKKINVHPRTIGMLNKMGERTKIGVSQAHTFTQKGKGLSLDKVFDIARQLQAI